MRRARPGGQGGDDVAAEATGRRASRARSRGARRRRGRCPRGRVAPRGRGGRLDKTRLSLHDNGDGTVSGHFTVPDLHGQLLRKILESMTSSPSWPARRQPGAGGGAGHSHRLGPRAGTGVLRARRAPAHRPAARQGRGNNRRTARQECARRGAAGRGPRHRRSHLGRGEARRLACGAGLLPAVLGGASHVLDLGWSKRLFSEAQRVACGLTHVTCAADGCERPFAWCEMHHRRPWSAGGRPTWPMPCRCAGSTIAGSTTRCSSTATDPTDRSPSTDVPRFRSPTISRNSRRLPRVAPVDRALLPTLVTRPQVDITITFYFRVRVHRPGRTSPGQHHPFPTI